MTTIRLRRGTSAQWTSANPVLAQGEPAVDTTTGSLKVGDGTTRWLDLPSFRDADTVAALAGIGEVIAAEEVAGGTYTVDPTKATYFSLELTGDVSLAAAGFVEGRSITVELVQDAVGGRLVSLPATWVGSSTVAVQPDPGTLERLVVWRAAGRMNVQQAGGGPFALPAT